MSFQPNMIAPMNSGVAKNKKPFLLLNDAFQNLENAYCWRERIKKRLGIKLVGRLRRVLTGESLGNTDASGNFSGNIITILSLEASASIEEGNISITVGGQTFTETATPDGLLSNGGSGTGTINYATGDLTLNTDPDLGTTPVTIDFNYFPNLPVMGIGLRELGAINVEETAFFDTTYVYTYGNDEFSDASTITTWAGDDSDFFWTENYRGSTANSRLFFATNFASPALDPANRIRYTNSLTMWTTFTPAVDLTNSIFQCRLIIAYYGRLLFLNTWEGTTAGGALNYFNRCRFSQIGDPTAADAWRSDQFGKGGFIDAPTNEQIVSARFYKNTLIVFFEKTTWELRYVGDYGLPFIWERISSDFGSESTFSTVLFDDGVLGIGDKAIIGSSGNDVQRIDLQIPDQVFEFKNENNAKERVQGIRDFQKQLVYWSFIEGGTEAAYPNRVLLYNYENSTWATFRDNVTAFGVLQTAGGDSWDDPISWDSDTSWDTLYTVEFPSLVCGNQQGFIHYYQYESTFDTVSGNKIPFQEEESLYISAVTRNASAPLRITSPNHNLENLEIIYISGMLFADTATPSALTTTLNDAFYQVSVVDSNNLDLYYWDGNGYIETSEDNLEYTPAPGTGTYMGGGVIALFPKMNIVTKDFNPYQQMGVQWKTSYTDFQFDATPNSFVTVNIYSNSNLATVINSSIYDTRLSTSVNLIGSIQGASQANPCVITSSQHGLTTGRKITIASVTGMTELNNNLYTVTVIDLNSFSINVDSSAFTAYVSGGYWNTVDANFFYSVGANYAWHRFYSNVFGQYITYQITYDDALMNDANTHRSAVELNALTLYSKPAGRFA